MKKILCLMVILWAHGVYAYQVNAVVTCKEHRDQTIATLTVTGYPNAEDMGLPGLLYLGVARPSGDDAVFFSPDEGGWVEYSGGQLPMAEVNRAGINNFFLKMNVTQFLNDGRALYFGYGSLTPKIEEIVTRRRDALKRMKERHPEKTFNEPSDDFVRRSLIESDMRKVGRYTQVLPAIRCSSY